jgi:hypothetical protein
MFSHSPCVGQAGAHSLCNQISLELRHRADNVKQQLPAWRRRVDSLRKAHEIDAQGPEFFQAIHQVLERSRETVELPNQHHVKYPLPGILQQVIKRRATTLGSADAMVDVFVGAAEALASVAAQVSQLQVTVLVQGTDASIEGNRLVFLILHVPLSS